MEEYAIPKYGDDADVMRVNRYRFWSHALPVIAFIAFILVCGLFAVIQEAAANLATTSKNTCISLVQWNNCNSEQTVRDNDASRTEFFDSFNTGDERFCIGGCIELDNGRHVPVGDHSWYDEQGHFCTSSNGGPVCGMYRTEASQ